MVKSNGLSETPIPPRGPDGGCWVANEARKAHVVQLGDMTITRPIFWMGMVSKQMHRLESLMCERGSLFLSKGAVKDREVNQLPMALWRGSCWFFIS